MTTLLAGNSASFTLGTLQSLNISTGGTGTLSFTSSSEMAQPSFMASVANGDFGPYNVSMAVVMTMTAGSADYTVVGGADVTAVVDPLTGGITGLSASGITLPIASKKLKAVIFGDSMTAQNRADSATFVNYSDRGYFTWANAYLGNVFELAANVGVNGNTTTQMLARIQADVIDYSPGWCFVLGGYNDVVNSVSYSTIIANLQTIYERLIGNGINVVAMAILPSSTYSTAAMREVLAKVNLWIRQYARTHQGMVFVDTYTPLLDPSSATGTFASGMLQVDGIHPSTKGAKAVGYAIYTALRYLLAPSPFPQSPADQVSADSLNGNIIPNPTMYGSGAAGGGASGNIATNWNSLISGTSAAGACSKVARSDYPGLEWQQMVCTSVVGNTTTYYIYKAITRPASVPIGAAVSFSVEVNIAALTGATISTLKPYIQSDSGTLANAFACGNNDGLIDGTGTYIFRTPDFVIPAANSSLTVGITITLSAADGSCTLQVGRSELRVVS